MLYQSLSGLTTVARIIHRLFNLFNIIYRMNTTSKCTSKYTAGQADTSIETRERAAASLAFHVNLTARHLSFQSDRCDPYMVNSKMNQVEQLFPEFFTRCSYASFTENYRIKTNANRRLNRRLKEPLVQSWLLLYGGGLPQD